MPRHARLDVPGALHHIMVRGNNKTVIFRDETDRRRFIDRLGETVTEAGSSIYAWVLMNNHVHLLFKSGDKGISAVMRKLLTWYAIYFNRRHRRTGHLFDNRYKSVLCEEDSYLLTLIRYIHLNPLRAKVRTTMEDLDHFPWSGHRALMGKTAHAWMDTAYVWAQFGNTKRKAITAYKLFVEQGMGKGHSSELSGGGLVRSIGGWSQVVAAHHRGERIEYDDRILGSGPFVSQVLHDTEEGQRRQLRARTSGMTIELIIAQECEKARISPDELTQGSRRKMVSTVRSQVAWRAIHELGLSSAEIARHLGVATSSITRAIAKREQ